MKNYPIDTVKKAISSLTTEALDKYKKTKDEFINVFETNPEHAIECNSERMITAQHTYFLFNFIETGLSSWEDIKDLLSLRQSPLHGCRYNAFRKQESQTTSMVTNAVRAIKADTEIHLFLSDSYSNIWQQIAEKCEELEKES